MNLEQARADYAECARLEAIVLTPAQRAYLAAEKAPRWDLDPRGREDYDHPREYVEALGRYADACMATKRG